MCRQEGVNRMMSDAPYNIRPICGREPIFSNTKIHPFDPTEKGLEEKTTESADETEFCTNSSEKQESSSALYVTTHSNGPSTTMKIVRSSSSSYDRTESNNALTIDHDDHANSSIVDADEMDDVNQHRDLDHSAMAIIPVESHSHDDERLIDCINDDLDEHDSPPSNKDTIVGDDAKSVEESMLGLLVPQPPTHFDRTKGGIQSRILSPAIKISPNDKIPINPKGPWRRMKSLNVEKYQMEPFPKDQKTILLSPIPVSSSKSTECTSFNHKVNLTSRKQVHFDAVDIRCFAQTIGDNPSVTIGTPITLDWVYQDEEHTSLDAFEEARMPNRKKGNNRIIMHRLALNYYQRRNILLYYAGCTDEDVNRAEKEVARARYQRQITAMFSDLWRFEDLVTSAGRKTKRFFVRQPRE